MTKRPTDDDLTKLVDAATHLFNSHEAWDRLSEEHQGWAAMGRLGDALAPFKSDPEGELIEKMAEAYVQVLNGHCNPKDPLRVQAMKAALAVVKREGLPA